MTVCGQQRVKIQQQTSETFTMLPAVRKKISINHEDASGRFEMMSIRQRTTAVGQLANLMKNAQVEKERNNGTKFIRPTNAHLRNGR